MLFTSRGLGTVAPPWLKVPRRMQSRKIALLNRMWLLVAGADPRTEQEFGQLLDTYFPSSSIHRFPLAIRKDDASAAVGMASAAERGSPPSRRKLAEMELKNTNTQLSLACAMKWAVGHQNFFAHRRAALVLVHASLRGPGTSNFASTQYRARGLSWGSEALSNTSGNMDGGEGKDEIIALKDELVSMAGRYDRLRRKFLQKQHECDKLMRSIRRSSRLSATKQKAISRATTSPPQRSFPRQPQIHLKSPLFKSAQQRQLQSRARTDEVDTNPSNMPEKLVIRSTTSDTLSILDEEASNVAAASKGDVFL